MNMHWAFLYSEDGLEDVVRRVRNGSVTHSCSVYQRVVDNKFYYEYTKRLVIWDGFVMVIWEEVEL